MSSEVPAAGFDLLSPIDQLMHPYREQFPANLKLPSQGHSRDQVLAELLKLREIEEGRWRDGYASGSVYHGGAEHIEFLNQVYAINSQANQLHSDLWPSAAKFEAEIVAMTAHMLNADQTGAPFGSEHGVCGSVSSGGSESILLAMKTYRDWAEDKKGITEPEIVVPVSGHAAFHKAAQYFKIKLVPVGLDANYRADVDQVVEAINDNTVAVVGSAPIFRMARSIRWKRCRTWHWSEVWVFMSMPVSVGSLPWAESRDAPCPRSTSACRALLMSCDTHKYGFAARETSVVLYRGQNYDAIILHYRRLAGDFITPTSRQ